MITNTGTEDKEFGKFFKLFSKSAGKFNASSVNLYSPDTVFIDNKPEDQKNLFRSEFFSDNFISVLRENDKIYFSICIAHIVALPQEPISKRL